jgi:ABC-type transport system substrate-binding protein
MAVGPISIAWEPDSAMYGMYEPDNLRNSSRVNDPKLLAMLKEQRRTKDLEARKKLIFDIQRYIAEQQYYVFTISTMFACTWQPYVKNYAPNLSFDYGSRVAALWLDR